MLDRLLIILFICLIAPTLLYWSHIINIGKYRVIRSEVIAEKMRSAVFHQGFLESNKFNFHDSFQYRNIELGVWSQSNTNALARYYSLTTSSLSEELKGIDRSHEQKNFQLVTLFSNGISLTSTVSSSAFLFPRPPGSFLQSKKTDSIEDLWNYHLEGEDFLLNDYGIEPSIITDNIEYRLNEEIKTQGRYIRQIPFFWFKSPYWVYIHRFRMLGVSVRKQFSR